MSQKTVLFKCWMGLSDGLPPSPPPASTVMVVAEIAALSPAEQAALEITVVPDQEPALHGQDALGLPSDEGDPTGTWSIPGPCARDDLSDSSSDASADMPSLCARGDSSDSSSDASADIPSLCFRDESSSDDDSLCGAWSDAAPDAPPDASTPVPDLRECDDWSSDASSGDASLSFDAPGDDGGIPKVISCRDGADACPENGDPEGGPARDPAPVATPSADLADAVDWPAVGSAFASYLDAFQEAVESAASDPDNLGHIDVQGTTLRGWINEQLLHKYKIVARDEDGSVIPEFSLLHLLENCTDFKNETSQLEYLCEALGVRAVITTKYHAEYAGEGVEYSWGLSKLRQINE